MSNYPGKIPKRFLTDTLSIGNVHATRAVILAKTPEVAVEAATEVKVEAPLQESAYEEMIEKIGTDVAQEDNHTSVEELKSKEPEPEQEQEPEPEPEQEAPKKRGRKSSK